MSVPKIPPQARLLAAGMRLFFRLLYNQMAWSYDFVAAAVSIGMWQDWVRAVLPYLSGPRVLELGFGPGHLQEALRAQGIFSTGIDASSHMARQAYRRLQKAGKGPDLVNGYAQRLPFRSQAFNQVVATFPTDYIVSPLCLAEIRRTLHPSGRLVVLPLAWITDQRLPYRLAGSLARVTGEAPEWDTRQRDYFVEPIQNSGFEVEISHLNLPSSRLLLLLATPTGD